MSKANMLKVLYLSYDGATEPIPQSQVIPYLRELHKKGYEMHWISYDKEGAFKTNTEKEEFKKDLMSQGIIWYSLTYHKGSTLYKFFDMLAGILFAAFIVITKRINFTHGRAELSSVIGYVIKKVLGKKFIYDRRGYMAEDYIEGGMWKSRDGLNYRLLNFLDILLLKESEHIVVLTERIKKILLETKFKISGRLFDLTDKITVIPCCVDLDKFVINEKKEKLLSLNLKDKFVFVYSGSIGTWYMLREMIDFFLVARKKIPNAHFLILTLTDPEFVKDVIREKKVNVDDFTVTGAPPGRIHEYVSLGNVAIAFIKPVFSKLSSSPTKFGECLACGLPFVINSNIGDTDSLIKKHSIGSVVTEFTEDGYNAAILNLCKLLEDAGTLKKNCREFAFKHMSLAGGVKKYLDVYREMELITKRN